MAVETADDEDDRKNGEERGGRTGKGDRGMCVKVDETVTGCAMDDRVLDEDVGDSVEDKDDEVEPGIIGSKNEEEAAIEFEDAAVEGFDIVGPDNTVEEESDGVGHDCLRPWCIDEHRGLTRACTFWDGGGILR